MWLVRKYAPYFILVLIGVIIGLTVAYRITPNPEIKTRPVASGKAVLEPEKPATTSSAEKKEIQKEKATSTAKVTIRLPVGYQKSGSPVIAPSGELPKLPGSVFSSLKLSNFGPGSELLGSKQPATSIVTPIVTTNANSSNSADEGVIEISVDASATSESENKSEEKKEKREEVLTLSDSVPLNQNSRFKAIGLYTIQSHQADVGAGHEVIRGQVFGRETSLDLLGTRNRFGVGGSIHLTSDVDLGVAATHPWNEPIKEDWEAAIYAGIHF